MRPPKVTVIPRRPYHRSIPGYRESDRDYLENNAEAAIALLDWALGRQRRAARVARQGGS